jgi:hypothetical protein
MFTKPVHVPPVVVEELEPVYVFAADSFSEVEPVFP